MITSFLLVAEEEKQEEKYGASHTAPPQTTAAPSGHHSTVWQLSKELKMKAGKKSRARSRYEECYTDKDRAAAVNMGSRDIKQSLKMKRKAEKSKELSLPEETEPGALLALAGYEMTAKRTNIALDFINKALDLNPEDKHALVARSKCYLLLGEAKKALEDAEAALTIDHSFIKALYQKAEALYYLGDFEHSLMYFHRGLRLRPDMEGFRLGVQKAQEAIENIIGSRTTGMLATPEQLTQMLNGMRTVDELYKAAVLDLGKEPHPAPPTSSQAGSNGDGSQVKKVHKSVGKKRAEKQLLGDLYVDKVYLEDLLTNKLDIISLNQDFANNDVATHAKEGIEFLTTRQDFWRQQKPKHSGPIKIKRRDLKKKESS
ncbi:TPR [Nesidiocoris tenuis]|nr:TPR [Nesidiocoris tenuis]